ncbi:MAG TPA: lamin tail domain-containing protein [Chitinophagaceae bacterium]|nr:lamin tail domain-containing protein [Chitinophagaceae bacterium]
MNKKFLVFCYPMMFLCIVAKAQVSENFNDGDFTNNPAWSGGISDFIVNSSLQLQSNNTTANSTFFLSTPNSLATTAQWEMYIHIAFNPSSANYIDVYLIASAADLTQTTTTGYFVRIGNTDDEICLYRKDAGGVITKIIDGVDGILNNSDNVMKIKVSRNASSQWTLSRDMTGTGNSYVSEGTATDTTYTTSAYFGFLIKQSTASFFQKHFFDDIVISNYVPDTTPPVIESATATSSSTVDLLFNESLEPSSSQDISNYSADNGLGMPLSAVLDGSNSALVHLTFPGSLTNGIMYTLTVNNVKDIAGNAIGNGTAIFSYYTPQQYDVVIDEIMADPTPQVGLPNSEWVELKNTTMFPINLQGWKLADATDTSGALPGFILKPDSFVIVCTGSAVARLSPFGTTISVTNFPSLDNDGDLLALYNANGNTMHAVKYTSAWYQNALKQSGGWSLEMTDTKNPCSGISNWKASVDPSGGTPGRKNSVDGTNNDDTAPKLLRAFATSNTEVILVFDEPLDSTKAAAAANYTIDNGISAVSAEGISPVFNTVHLILNTAITANTVYTVTAAMVTDCKGNAIGSNNSARFGLALDADSLDVVINEILYNPRPGGYDYVELYNRSQKIIDLSHVYIASRNSYNAIGSIEQVTTQPVLLFPKDYMVLTESPDTVKSQYVTTNPDGFVAVSPMPSFPDDAGAVIILNNQGNIIDEVDYSDKWQFPLLANTEGVSLERINYDGPSAQSNFHSAATSAGYGTPAYKNSQYGADENSNSFIKVTPDIFSPDNDGIDDYATISYNFPSPGYVANITIFDASGQPVRYLQKNSLSGTSGYYRWDGLDDKNRKLPQGIYIIYTEIFNPSGQKKQFKNTIVLARRH